MRERNEQRIGRPALEGIRILDFTRAQQGPFATMLLADMGAEVWKVEPPGGEQGRANGLGPDGFSSYFEGYNRGKKSITLDLRNPEAIAAVRKLVPLCDVVVENFRPGAMERMGLGYDDLRQLREDIILASASAWGRKGPWADRGGFADQIGAMLLAFGISTALVVRERDGFGQHIDGSLIGGMVAMQSKQIMEFLRTGKQTGFERRRAAAYTNYECADGRHIAIAAMDQGFWETMCDGLDEPRLKTDERFADPWGRAKNKDLLVTELDRIFRKRTLDEWLERLAGVDFPYAPVLDYAGMAAHPQYWANDYLVEVDSPHLGRMRVPGAPIHMSATPPRVESAGPQLGANTEEILLAAGYSWDEVAALNQCGATRMA